MKRCIFVFKYLNFGEVERATFKIALEYKNRGFDVQFISLYEPSIESLIFIKKNNFFFSLINCDVSNIYLNFYKLVKIIRKSNPKYIFCIDNGFFTTSSMLFVSASHKELFIHSYNKNISINIFKKIYYFLAKISFDSISFSSSILLKEALKIYPGLKQKAFISRSILNPSENVSRKLKNNLLDKETIVIGGIGSFIKNKRFDLFINLAKLLVEESDKFRFIILGDGPLKSELKARAKLFEIDQLIEWRGFTEDTHYFYNSIDILVFFSEEDCSPIITPLEAMANDIPVVASCKFSKLNQLLENEINCFIQDKNDINLLVRQILLIISDYKFVNKIVASGKLLLQNSFSPKPYFSELVKRIKT